MDLEIFLGLMFLLFWLLCEAICIWLIFRDMNGPCFPPVYGGVSLMPPSRQHTPNKPNFYK